MKRSLFQIVPTALCLAIGTMAAVVIVAGVQREGRDSPRASEPTAAAGLDSNQTLEAAPSEKRFAVHVRRPEGPPKVQLSSTDPQGRSAEVACSTCHSVRPPQLENSAAKLDEFHQGLKWAHGDLTCYACHNPDDADTLRLADGSALEYVDVMTLCSQCHGPQATAFEHGAHGGMNGFWDLSRGPQTKNNCVDCHDPHAPAYPKMVVGFKPKDRFNAPVEEHDESHATAAEHE